VLHIHFRFPPEVTKYLNLAAFIVIASVSSSTYEKTYLVKERVFYYDLLKQRIVKDEWTKNRSKWFDYALCYLFNVAMSALVFSDGFVYLFGCYDHLYEDWQCRPHIISTVISMLMLSTLFVPAVGFIFAPNIEVYVKRLLRAAIIASLFFIANLVTLYGGELISFFGVTA
jgi:hypothetical protein